MPTGFQFTVTQIAEIKRLRDELALPENASLPSGAVPLYSYIFKCVTGVDLATTSIGAISLMDIAEDQRQAATWLAGAVQVNSASGAFSNVIREFNIRQGELRGKGSFGADLLQKASNNVGINLADSILNATRPGDVPNPTYHRLPTVQEIGASDLNGVRDVLYPGNENPGSELYLNQAWPGIVMLGALGGKYWDRLLRYDETQPAVLDALGDFKAMLLCWDAFKTAWDKTCVGVTSISDVMISMNFPASIITSVLAEYTDNGAAGVAGMVFNALINMQQPSADVSEAMGVITVIGSNRFLDMLMGAVQGKSLLGTTTDTNFTANVNAFFGPLSASQLQAIGAVPLPRDAASLAGLAQNDVNVRAALAALSIVKVQVGNEVANEFSLYDPATGHGNITQNWITDRAALTAYNYQKLQGFGGIFNGSENLRYYDAASNIEVLVGSGSTLRKKFLFGGDGADSLSGGGIADRLYGGRGSDTLEGLGGADYLEGNADNDSLSGGAGADTLLGGVGNDMLDGGTDSDALYGGAGTDTYAFTTGHGSDTIIEDAAGEGVITINGTTIQGGKKVVGQNHWSSEDGQYWFTVIPNGGGGNDLVISNATSPDTITIRNWQEGHLGISLPDVQAPPPPPPPAERIYVGDFQKMVAGSAYVFDGLNYASAGEQAGADDMITGSAEGDQIYGLGGNDALSGMNGDDLIEGGEGDDVLMGGLGADTLIGGAGKDFIVGSGHGGQNKPTSIHFTPPPASDSVWSRGFNWAIYGSYYSGSIIGVDVGALAGDAGNHIAGGAGDDEIYAGSGNDIVDGGADNDVVFGLGGSDLLSGGVGNDLIWGDGTNDAQWLSGTAPDQNGADVIDGGDGHDTIVGQGHNDALYGGTGDDKLYGDSANYDDGYGLTPVEVHGEDYLDGGDGNDTLVGGGRNDRLLGGADDDMLFGDDEVARAPGSAHGHDYLDGGNGNDYLQGDGGTDTLIGGVGNDVLWGDTWRTDLDPTYHGRDRLEAGAGNDQLIGGGNGDELFGGDGADRMNGDAADSIVGGAWHGDDSLDGGGGNDAMAGDGGSDTLVGGEGADMMWGDADDLATQYHGNDTLLGGASGDALYGNGGSDMLDGGADDDQLNGGEGNDTLLGGTGKDILRGGQGNDTYVYRRGDGQDRVEDEGGTDTLKLDVDPGSLTLVRSGADLFIVLDQDPQRVLQIVGQFAADSGALESIQFADGTVWDAATIAINTPSAGPDTVTGTAGSDTYTVDDPADQISEAAGGGVDTVNASVSYALPYNVENLTLTGLVAINATGNSANNVLIGNIADNCLAGLDGHDSLYGGAGNDVLMGNAGVINDWATDYMAGGVGDDTYYAYANGSADDIVVEYSGEGIDTVYSNANYALPDNVENLTILDYYYYQSYTLTGNALNNILIGDSRQNQNTFFGGQGADTMIAPAGGGTFHVDNIGDVIVSGTGLNAQSTAAVHVYSSVSWTLDPRFTNLYLQGTNDIDGTGNDLANDVYGNDGANVLRGGGGDDEMYDYDGNDTVYGDGGNDRLASGRGDDWLYGGAGNDTLDGGHGTDWLDGGAGDDFLGLGNYAPGMGTIVFGSGSGHDLVVFGGQVTAQVQRRVLLGEGIAPSQVQVGREGRDLSLQLAGGDRLLLSGYFADAESFTPANVLSYIEFADGQRWVAADIRRLLGGPAGSEGNDEISGTEAGEKLEGLAGNDALLALEGNDTLVGGTGDDMLDGGAGNDVYIFARGDGKDVLTDVDATPGNTDIVRFAGGISAADVVVTRDLHNLYLNLGGDRLTLRNWMDGEASRIERVEFADGTVWTQADLVLAATHATDLDDYLTGTPGNDTIDGLGGNDVIAGGAGGDVLDGGSGNDVYLYRRGDGSDTISDVDSTTGNIDAVRFDATVLQADVTIKRSGPDLLLHISGGSDVIRLSNWFVSEAHRIERAEFADGTYWTLAEFVAGLPEAGDGDDILTGTDADDSIDGLGGNDQLYGKAGADVLVGGAGDDVLQGGAGNDVYLFGRGHGSDTIDDQDATAGDLDTVRFDATVSASEVRLTRDLSNLYISIAGTADRIRVSNWFGGAANRVERIEFADGTVWDAAYIAATVTGSDGDDFLQGNEEDDVLRGAGGNDGLVGGGGSDTLDGGSGNDYLEGEAGDDFVLGGSGNDYMQGGAGQDTMLGGEDDDSLSAGTGDDTLHGGAGLDMLQGGAGNDTYLFQRGDGADTIDEFDETVGNSDTLLLGAGISADDIELTRDYANLYVSIRGTGDRIKVGNWYGGQGYRIERIVFADGTSWDAQEIAGRVTGSEGDDFFAGTGEDDILKGAGGNDGLVGGDGNDTLDGGSGNDYLEGEAGNDVVLGGSGNDYMQGGAGSDTMLGGADDDSLSAGAGDDTLHGGSGVDMLQGGTGNDTYLFKRGDGADSISEFDETAGNSDTLLLDAGIGVDDVVLTRDYSHLYISIKGTGDRIQVGNWFSGQAYRIENVVFADGTVWGAQEIAGRVTGSEGDDFFAGDGEDDILQGAGGNDGLVGAGGNDTLDGGSGNDYLEGEAGDDLVLGGSGDDYMQGGTGNDTLHGGANTDNLQGGMGDDVYLFQRGDGTDSVEDNDTTVGNVDTVRLGAGISVDDIEITRDYLNLYIGIKGTADRLRLSNWFGGEAYAIEKLEFADGTVWDLPARMAASVVPGTGASDTLVGSSADEFLYGGGADDVLEGGAGDDVLIGGARSDTYRFARGWGQDKLMEETAGGASDCAEFAADVTSEQLWFRQVGSGPGSQLDRHG